MKSPEQIARDMLDEHVRGVRSDITDAALIAWMTRAIEADRAQLRDKLLDYDEWERLASDDEPAVRMTKIKEVLA